jgi:pyruvate dehydrogenase E1 component
MPKGVEEGIIKGMYPVRESDPESKLKINLLGSGAILRETLSAADILQDVYGVASDVWSVTSYSELRREGLEVHRWNMLHPSEEKRMPFVTRCLRLKSYPVVAVSDYMRVVADQVQPFVRNHFTALGTDGYGRSDTRHALRRHFEVDRYYIVVAALNALADKGYIGRSKVADAISRFNIDPEKPDPMYQ